MSVYYHCPNPACGMIFGTTRERRAKPQAGAFSCTVCETEVLRWSDRCDFSDWMMVTKPPTRPATSASTLSGAEKIPVPHG